MSNQKPYIRQASEVTGNTTAFSEIIINASPQEVRAKFVDFKTWSEWNSIFPEVVVKSGNINDLSSKPTLGLVLNFGRKNDPAPAPVNPRIYENSPEVFYWGFKWGVLDAAHVHIFESVDGGSKTRFVNYERMTGLIKGMIMRPEMRGNMVAKYNIMNEEFKKWCEASN